MSDQERATLEKLIKNAEWNIGYHTQRLEEYKMELKLLQMMNIMEVPA